MATDWKPGDPIGYVRPEIPDFEMPDYQGERYEAMVPDTLDLADRARLVVHALTESTNPQADYEPYWTVSWTPVPRMAAGGFASPNKSQEAVCLCRLMSGSQQNLHVDRRWMEATLKQQGPDGLIYVPTRGRPWVAGEEPRHIAGLSPSYYNTAQIISPFAIGQVLRNLSLFAAREDDSSWIEVIRGVVDGLNALAVHAGKYAYYWPGPLYAVKERPANTRPQYHFHDVEESLVYWGLVSAYRSSGYEPARKLAGKLIAYYRATFFTSEGEFLTTQEKSVKGHVHAHARGLLAMAEYGVLDGDADLLQFVIRSYDWAKRQIETLTGFTPNLLDGPEWRGPTIPGDLDQGTHPSFTSAAGEFNGCEIMGLADMIATALVLSEAGIADYWDDADRWVRNMLAEAQLLQSDWVYHLPGATSVSINVGPGETTDRVPERCLGGWATGAALNDWYESGTPSWYHEGEGTRGFLHGDTIGGGRAIFWVWNRILGYRDGKLKVNLLLNRASPWADVDSYIPYQGRVEIKVKQPLDLSVRIPEWVKPRDVRVHVNAAERTVGWDGRYAKVGEVRPGDSVALVFPIDERTDVVYVEKRKYTLVRRGNDVVEIFPRGRYYPFYRRRHYRSAKPRWRKVERFVSAKQIDW